MNGSKVDITAKKTVVGFLANWGSTIFGLIAAGVLLQVLTR